MPIVNLMPFIRAQFFDANGNPLSAGTVGTFVAGTTTPQSTYTDSTGTILNTNPVTLDSTGTASIWLIQNAAYKFVIKNSDGVVIETIDNVLTPFTGSTSLGPQKQVFTGGGTFTIPTGVSSLKVTVVAGGGAGGGSTAAPVNGSGGGAGGTGIKWLSGLTPGLTLTVTVGAGGTGVASNSGNPGATSSVASGTQSITTITTNGGTGGVATGSTSNGVAGGAAGTGGDINMGGGGSQPGIALVGGGGGNSIFGGAAQPNTGTPGNAGVAPGAGGGGSSGAAGTGGAGAAGVVIFEWVA